MIGLLPDKSAKLPFAHHSFPLHALPFYSSNTLHLRDFQQISFSLLTRPVKSALGELPQPKLNNCHS